MTVSTLYLKHSQGSTPLILRRGPIAYRTNGLWSWCFECFRQEGVSYRRRGRKRTSQNDRNNHENIKKRLSLDLLHSWAIIKTVVQLKLKLIAWLIVQYIKSQTYSLLCLILPRLEWFLHLLDLTLEWDEFSRFPGLRVSFHHWRSHDDLVLAWTVASFDSHQRRWCLSRFFLRLHDWETRERTREKHHKKSKNGGGKIKKST